MLIENAILPRRAAQESDLIGIQHASYENVPIRLVKWASVSAIAPFAIASLRFPW